MVTAVTMVRDEADIVEQTVTRMLGQVDRVIVADNGSTDGTREILERLDVTVVDDPEPGYFQSRKMTELAARAIRGGATWVVPFDADEVWMGAGGQRVADVLNALPGWALVAEASLYDHVATAKDPEGDPVSRLGWRRETPTPLPKVAARAAKGLVIHQGNHGASFDNTDLPPTVKHLLTARHFPYRSVEQFVSKVRNGAAAYAATDLPEHMGAHWRQWGRILDEQGEDGLADLFRKWYWRAEPDMALTIEGEHQPALVYDPCP